MWAHNDRRTGLVCLVESLLPRNPRRDRIHRRMPGDHALEHRDNSRELRIRPDPVEPRVHRLLDSPHSALELTALRGQLEDDLAAVAGIRGRTVDQAELDRAVDE